MIRQIILSADYQSDKNVGYNDFGTDVIVQLDNGDRYVATFFSYKNLEGMLDTERRSKEYRSEKYYRILDMVLVRDFNKGNLLPVIECMMAEGDFQLVFKKI